jgi:sugar phosphate permease
MSIAPRWRVVALAALALAFAQGVRTSFGVFVPAVEADLGLSRAWLGTLAGLVYLVYGAAQPVMGQIADRVGAGRVISSSLLLLGAGALLTSRAESSLAFGAAWLLVATPGFAGTASATATAAIAAASGSARGTALGVLAAAFPLGGVVIGPLTVLAMGPFGWRNVLVVDALVCALLLAPLIARFVGLKHEAPAAEPARGDRRGMWLAMAREWPIYVPYLVAGISSGFIIVHFVALAIDRQASTDLIALAVGLLAAPNIIGALASGWLSERFPRGRLLAAIYFTRAVAFVLLLTSPGAAVLIPFAILSSLVDFANFAPAVSLAADRLRSRLGTGAIAGALSLCYNIGAATGSAGAGLLREQTGSYDGATVVSIAALIASGCVSLVLERRRAAPISFL